MGTLVPFHESVVETIRKATTNEIGIICDLIKDTYIPPKHLDVVGVALVERYVEGEFPTQQMYEDVLDNLESRKQQAA